MKKSRLLLLVAILLVVLGAGTQFFFGTSKIVEKANTMQEVYEIVLGFARDGNEMGTIVTTFDPSSFDEEEVRKMAEAEGEYFAANFPSIVCTIKKSGSKYKMQFILGSMYNPTKFQEKQVDVVVNGLVKECEGFSDYEKIKYTYDYIILHCEYANGKHGAYHALCGGGAVCNGYARAFLRVMEGMGIPCKYTTGENHAWNTVYLEGKWYNLDTTWGDSGGNTINYEYFLKSNSDWTGLGPVRADAMISYPATNLEERYEYPDFLGAFYRKLVIEIVCITLFLVFLFILAILLAKIARKKSYQKRYQKNMIEIKQAYSQPFDNEYRSPYEGLDQR